MTDQRLKVGVVGYGTIGKRVAQALNQHPECDLKGVAIRSLSNSSILDFQIPIFYADARVREEFNTLDVATKGSFNDLIEEVDLIVDCGTSKKSSVRLSRYQDASVKSIFQGGEKHEKIGFTFSSFANYDDAKEKSALKIGSCNTTGLVRTLLPLHCRYGIDSVHGVMVRCATDPNKAEKGVSNAAHFVPGLSHHGEDIERLIPGVKFYSQAVAVPMIFGHVAFLSIRMKHRPDRDETIEILRESPRVQLSRDGQRHTTAELYHAALEKNRSRDDTYEVVIVEESIDCVERELKLMIWIHMEAIVIPDTLDCVSALLQPERAMVDVCSSTDEFLNILSTSTGYQRIFGERVGK